MAEGAVAQLKDVPGTIGGTARRKPFLAIGVMVGVLVIVLLIEAFKPGLITGPIRKGLRAIGVSSA